MQPWPLGVLPQQHQRRDARRAGEMWVHVRGLEKSWIFRQATGRVRDAFTRLGAWPQPTRAMPCHSLLFALLFLGNCAGDLHAPLSLSAQRNPRGVCPCTSVIHAKRGRRCLIVTVQPVLLCRTRLVSSARPARNRRAQTRLRTATPETQTTGIQVASKEGTRLRRGTLCAKVGPLLGRATRETCGRGGISSI